MPTALPVAFPEADANVRLQYNKDFGFIRNSDLALVAAFTAFGLALTVALAGFFPQAANTVALALSIG